MEPPLKRPRLSMFSRDLPPDETLTRARWRNDLSLKSRFEAIFEKYAQDFTGIGDEIEVATGKVVVSNGHLEAMEDEKDTGTAMPRSRTSPNRSGNINGGSLLRAMTAAPEDHGHSFEHVQDDDLVLSIEAVAENAAVHSEEEYDDTDSRNREDPTDTGYNADVRVVHSGGVAHSYNDSEDNSNSSDEELFQTADNTSAEQTSRETAAFVGLREKGITEGWVRNAEYGEQILLNNDFDADIVIKQENDDHWQESQYLFGDQDNDRSSSPDSLFEVEEYSSGFQDREVEREGQEPAYPELPSVGREVSDDAILDKFGPRIGPQVIDVLQKRRAMMDAHIEPAWRVPDIGVVFPKPKLETPPDDLHLSLEPSSGRKDSLWRDSQAARPALEGLRYPTSRKVRGLSQLSNESEDPLQEDFNMAKDVKSVPEQSFRVSWDDLHDGICPFCRRQFSVKGSVYVHWDELIKKSARDDVHDMAYIRHQRRGKRRRSQFPKVTVQDFSTMIKLREVDNLDWQEIYDQGFFGQRPATSIQSIYYQYRTLAQTEEELAAEGRSWTAEEDGKLLGFCKDPTITFQKLRKLMRTRPQAELGNRLASIWMKEYAGQNIKLGSPQTKACHSLKTPRRGLRSSLEPDRTRRDSLESDRLGRSWSSDSMDSLFQVDVDVGVNGDENESDDGLFGAPEHLERSALPGK
jgi:Centromere protein Scm3